MDQAANLRVADGADSWCALPEVRLFLKGKVGSLRPNALAEKQGFHNFGERPFKAMLVFPT